MNTSDPAFAEIAYLIRFATSFRFLDWERVAMGYLYSNPNRWHRTELSGIVSGAGVTNLESHSKQKCVEWHGPVGWLLAAGC